MDGLINLGGQSQDILVAILWRLAHPVPSPPTSSSDPVPSLSLLPACVPAQYVPFEACTPADGLPLFSVAVTK